MPTGMAEWADFADIIVSSREGRDYRGTFPHTYFSLQQPARIARVLARPPHRPAAYNDDGHPPYTF